MFKGYIAFCMERFDYDVDSELLLRHAEFVGLHEISHAIGWSANLFDKFKPPGAPQGVVYGNELGIFTCVTGDGSYNTHSSKPQVLTPKYYDYENSHLYYDLQTSKMAQISRNIFNCPTMTGARLENQPTGTTCFGSHLDEVRA
jgi:hypothetical protein